MMEGSKFDRTGGIMTTPAQVKPGQHQHAPQAAVKPVETKPGETKPTETKPTETNPTETKPTGTKSVDFLADMGILDHTNAEMAVSTAPVRARSAAQQRMDDAVKALHTRWVTAGKPNTWPKLLEAKCVATFPVKPEDAAALKRQITKAVNLHEGTRPRYGSSVVVTEKMIKSSQGKIKPEWLGREIVSVAIMDKRPRGTSD